MSPKVIWASFVTCGNTRWLLLYLIGLLRQETSSRDRTRTFGTWPFETVPSDISVETKYIPVSILYLDPSVLRLFRTGSLRIFSAHLKRNVVSFSFRKYCEARQPIRMAAYKLVLIRHGESCWNQENRFCGWFDADLSDTGVQEAKRGGVALQGDALEQLHPWSIPWLWIRHTVLMRI